jgi:hypothetical protein
MSARSLTLAVAIAIATATGAGAQQHESHHHANAIALFLGGATHLATPGHEREDGFAIGIEYHRTLAEWLKAGLLAEWASSDRARNFVLIAPFSGRVVGGLFLVAGPGIESTPADDHHEAKTHLLGRLGAVYDIELGRLVIGPQFNADVSDGVWTLVYGATVGWAF